LGDALGGGDGAARRALVEDRGGPGGGAPGQIVRALRRPRERVADRLAALRARRGGDRRHVLGVAVRPQQQHGAHEQHRGEKPDSQHPD
jgi:hypothetical protein